MLWFSDEGNNPRDVIGDIVPNRDCKILDMCCGTMSNGMAIAKKNPKCRIYGIDRSEGMLREAKRKIKKSRLDNVKVKVADATATGLKNKCFDYVVVGLVLHECPPELKAEILKEAGRLLKDDGKLIVLEWEEQETFWRKIKYAPLYAFEAILTKSFKDFYRCDKKAFFLKHGFVMNKMVHCNYSSVMVLSRKDR